jgi:hypothetical protein
MLERETGLGGGVPGELERTGVNCRSEKGHLRLLSGRGDAPKKALVRSYHVTL